MKRNLQYYRAGRTPDYTRKKVAEKRKLMDRLNYEKSTHQKKESTISYS